MFFAFFLKFDQILTMAACYHTDSDSDASSSNFSIPPTVLSWKMKMVGTELGQIFDHYPLTPKSRSHALKTLPIPGNFRGVEGNSVCLSDSGEYMQEYTPAPPQRKKKFNNRETFLQPA